MSADAATTARNATADPDRAFSVRAAAEERGDAPALIAETRTWSWRDLATAAHAETNRLKSLGAGRGTRVAFEAAPAARTVVRLLAVLELEGCAVPLHVSLRPADRRARLRRAAPCIDMESGQRVEPDEEDPGHPAGAPLVHDPGPARPGGDAAMALLFTSGTGTGIPRAVELSRGAFAASADASAARLGWQAEDRWLCCLPLAHVGGLSIVTRCLAARRTVVLAPFDAVGTADLLAGGLVTLASLVPTMLHRMFAAAPEWRASSTLRAALLGGAAAPDALWTESERRGFPALATYGMTETCSQVATARPGSPRRLEPLDGVSLRVVGERIEVAGSVLCSRLDRPADAPSPWTADGYLRTGDRGRLEDGALSVLGRSDDVIVTGGENVDPVEVESVLAGHPGVHRAVVFGLPDPEWGEIVAAALETAPGTGDPELIDWASSRLAAHQRPRRLFRITDWPHTPGGKLDRRAIRARCATSGASATSEACGP